MIRTPVCAAVAYCLLATSMPQTAQAYRLTAVVDTSWQSAFPVQALGSYFSQGDEVIVIRAGQPSPELEQLAEVLREQLRASTRVRTVLDDGSLGKPDAEADDETLVKSAAHLPLTRIVVVRLVDSDDESQAVVTIYDRRGEVSGAFLAQKGQAIEMSDNHAAGLDSRAATAVSEVVDEVDPEHQEMGDWPDDYRDNFVHYFNTGVQWDSDERRLVGRPSRIPRRGLNAMPLKGKRFYQHIGRDDLARSYVGRRVAKPVLTWAGAAALTGGLLLSVFHADDGRRDCTTDSGEDDGAELFDTVCEANRLDARGKYIGGYVIASTGLVSMLIGIILRRDPRDDHERRELVEQYNSDLRAKYFPDGATGATEAEETDGSDDEESVALRTTPSPVLAKHERRRELRRSLRVDLMGSKTAASLTLRGRF